MRLLIQRVNKASVEAGGGIVGKIDKGLLLLLGIKKGDSPKNMDVLVEKLTKLRVMADKNDKMNLSIVDTNSEVLVVSQFTLYANTKDGNRPSFVDAEEPKKAKKLYEYFVEKLDSLRPGGPMAQRGSFGEYMKINAVLDGPVTIILES